MSLPSCSSVNASALAALRNAIRELPKQQVQPAAPRSRQGHSAPRDAPPPNPISHAFPTIQEQQGNQPCPSCHSSSNKDDKGSIIPDEFRKGMMTDEEMKAWIFGQSR